MNAYAMSSTGRENGQEASERLDPFRMYLYEISKHPVLTKEEEREIADRIRRLGDKQAEQRLVVANKMDLPEAKKNLTAFKRKHRVRVREIAALAGDGLDKLKLALRKTLA